jgi:hypothetical protein
MAKANDSVQLTKIRATMGIVAYALARQRALCVVQDLTYSIKGGRPEP